MVETHSELEIATIKIDNQMVVIQIQFKKNIVEVVLIDGRASVNLITKNLITKLGLPKPKLTTYANGKSEYDHTFRNQQKFEDSHALYSIYSHIYCSKK